MADVASVSTSGDGLEGFWSAAHADFLSSLSPAEHATLLGRARRLQLRKREHVFKAGDPSGTVFIVGHGCIKLYQLSPHGKQIILWFCLRGEIFGIAELVRGASREIFAEANAGSEILAISQSDFVAFLRSHPEASMRAIGILSARVRTLGSALVDIVADDVGTRIVRLLLRYSAMSAHVRCDGPLEAGETCINVALTHQDIANFIGASRQTVTTTLTEFRKHGTIRVVNRHMHVCETSELKRLLGPTQL